MATIPAESATFLTNSPTDTTQPLVEMLENANLASTAQDEHHVATNQALERFKNVETIALVVEKPKADFKMASVILDEVRDNEVLVEMKYSGICHTDIVLQQGLLPIVEFPAIFGHEGAGVIRAIGSKVKNKSLRPGDSVLLSFTTCGVCSACTSSHPAFCHSHATVNHNAVRITDRTTPARLPTGESVRSQYFGQSSFSKLSVVNEKCVVKCSYPEKMNIYAPIGCGIQTGAGTVLNVLKPRKDESVVVFGIGSVGLAAVMAARYMDVGMIVAVDIVPSRLELARELGATHAINSKETNAVTKIKEITNGGAKYAIDCTGLIKVIEDTVEAIGPEGTTAVVGVPPAEKKVSIDPLNFLLANKKFVGVIEGDSNPEEFIPRLIEMQQQGKFPIEKLSVVYPVARFEDAIHDMHSGKVIKPVIDWTSA